MFFKNLSSRLASICLLMVSMGGVYGQLPLLENDFRNILRDGGTPLGGPVDEGSLGPATANQFASGTALGGWQTTRILKGN